MNDSEKLRQKLKHRKNFSSNSYVKKSSSSGSSSVTSKSKSSPATPPQVIVSSQNQQLISASSSSTPYRETVDEEDGYSLPEQSSLSEDSSQSISLRSSSAISSSSGTPISKPFQRTRDYNREYEKLQSDFLSGRGNREQILQKISELSKEFRERAVVICKHLVTEKFESINRRMHANEQGKGVAGGLKFSISDFFIKFCSSTSESGESIYSAHQFANKSARHDLRHAGLINEIRFMHDEFRDLITTPLQSVFEWRGWRISCFALLPVSRETLVYGAPRYGQCVNCDEKFAEKMRTVGKILNLKEHAVFSGIAFGAQSVNVVTSGDTEVHRLEDGKYYFLDLHRLLPCENPESSKKIGSFLCNLLRPEFVRQWPSALCADSFSKWDYENIVAHKTDVKNATESLYKHVEKFCVLLRERFAHIAKESIYLLDLRPSVFEQICWFIHFHGINLRFLPKIHETVEKEDPLLSSVLRVEIIARKVRVHARHIMRGQTSIDSVVQSALQVFFRSVFKQRERVEEEEIIDTSTLDQTQMELLFFRVQELCSMKLGSLDDIHLPLFEPVITELPRVSWLRGLYYKHRGEEKKALKCLWNALRICPRALDFLISFGAIAAKACYFRDCLSVLSNDSFCELMSVERKKYYNYILLYNLRVCETYRCAIMSSNLNPSEKLRLVKDALSQLRELSTVDAEPFTFALLELCIFSLEETAGERAQDIEIASAIWQRYERYEVHENKLLQAVLQDCGIVARRYSYHTTELSGQQRADYFIGGDRSPRSEREKIQLRAQLHRKLSSVSLAYKESAEWYFR